MNFQEGLFLNGLFLLPAAVPAYIIAYTYTDLLEYAGPVQGYLREIFNWQNSQDYWFPNIRSLEGAVLVMSSVLYPYVYLLLFLFHIFKQVQFMGENLFLQWLFLWQDQQ
jgi:iron(III) transport system permease protein